MMESFRFYNWAWLILLPVIAGMIVWRVRFQKPPAVIFSSVAHLKSIPKTFWLRLRRAWPIFYGVGLFLLVIALARPQAGKMQTRISGEGIAIELVLDISGSMEALDFEWEGKQVSRLEAVKHVLSEFVLGSKTKGLAGRPDDLVGVVAFGGFADSKCPLTLDHGALVSIVRGLEIPRIVRDRLGRAVNSQSLQEELATAIGDGIALGVDRLRHARAKSKVLVLLTDGDNNAGAVEPREAAQIAKESGIKVYTIGIGHNGVVPVPQEDEFGKRVLVPARFRIDEDLLREIAQITDGQYFHASDAQGLSQVYAQIDKLEKSEVEETKYSEYRELYPWFAWPGVACLLLLGILAETRFRGLP